MGDDVLTSLSAAVGLVYEFEGIDKSQYDAVNAELGIDSATLEGDCPEGILSHAGGMSDAGTLIIMEVWESKKAQEAFTEGRLGAAIARSASPRRAA